MQVATLSQVEHGHLEVMKQLEKREARLREENLLLNERTRVLAKREHMLACSPSARLQGDLTKSAAQVLWGKHVISECTKQCG